LYMATLGDKPGFITLDEKGNTYSLVGKHRVYAKRGDLISNVIIIELIPKSSHAVVADWRHGDGICKIHHVAMKTVVVNGLAGPAPIFPPKYYEAKEKFFPNAGIEYPPQLYSDKKGMIYVCPKCEQAKKDWETRE
jgi:hypothetical protein